MVLPTFEDRLSSIGKDFQITASSSITVSELLARLSLIGCTLPVVPGVLGATLGGMLAADIHGKNHFQMGSLGRWVRSLSLMIPSGEVLECSEQNEPEIFRATLGGMGLTGVILSACLEVVPLKGLQAAVNVKTTESLRETIQQLESESGKSEYVSAWIDFSKGSVAPGRGVVVCGDRIADEQLKDSGSLWQPETGPSLPPIPGFGNTLVRWHNSLYHGLARWLPQQRLWPLESLLFPLESWGNWRKVYGQRGFYQHQSQIPLSQAEDRIQEIMDLVQASPYRPTLVVLKRMGEGRGGLSFGETGYTLSMDFANESGCRDLVHRLNEFVAEISGKIYLAKDSTLTQEQFEKMYPDVDGFRELRKKVDPRREIQSELSRRLGLKGEKLFGM